MNRRKEVSSFLVWSLPLAILASVILTSVLAFSVKEQIEEDFEGILFVIEGSELTDASLYYTYEEEFNASVRISNSSAFRDTLRFVFPEQGKMVKKFRLDLGTTPVDDRIRIKSLQLLFGDKRIVLNEKEAFDALFVHSASIALDKENRQIRLLHNTKPFDPYVVFSPVGHLSMPGKLYTGLLLLPFATLLCIVLFRYGRKGEIKMAAILCTLFIVCIPLKIAWTTFCTILLCAYGLYMAIRHKKIKLNNGASIALAAFFLIYLIFGRPVNSSVIEKELALLLFAFIGMTLTFPTLRTRQAFVYFFLFLNAVLISSGISYLWRFNDFYALGIMDYFTKIKIYSGNVRDWLYYDHAAFLSFFGLVGLLLLKEIKERKMIGPGFFYLYHVFLLLVILLMGSRICLVIYAVYTVNHAVRTSPHKRWVVNLFFLLALTIGLGYNIYNIDTNRYRLWTISWHAIKEKPWFGYGLGESERILDSTAVLNTTGLTAPEGLNHSHNQIFTSLLEIGSLGTLCILTILLVFLYKTRQHRNVSLGLFLFGLSYMFLTESILQTSKPLYVICFLFLLLSQDQISKINSSIAR